jgi:hypothetical protein
MWVGGWEDRTFFSTGGSEREGSVTGMRATTVAAPKASAAGAKANAPACKRSINVLYLTAS